MEQKCEELGLECAFPKPFCTLEPEKNKPTIARFIEETRVGRPLLDFNNHHRQGRGYRVRRG